MAEWATPFVLLNVGSEMLFVVAQRLQAQNSPVENNAKILDQLASVLCSDQVILQTIVPQPLYSHQKMRSMLENIVLSTLVRIEPDSLEKLWLLTNMVVKWQITNSSDIVKLTLRHLYEIENYIQRSTTQFQLHKVQSMIRNCSDWSGIDLHSVRSTILDWMEIFNTKVMILIKLGFQDENACFVTNNSTVLGRELLDNLGENLYFVTMNGEIAEKGGDLHTLRQTSSCELKLFIQQLLGQQLQTNLDNEANVFYATKLNNALKNEDSRQQNFVQIDVPLQENQLSEMFNEININDRNLTDDLIEMIDTFEDCNI